MVRISFPFTVVATLFASSVALCTNNGLAQMITHIKRHPSLTREQFYEYWYTKHAPKVLPLVNHFNMTNYQQIRVAGKIPPIAAGASEPASSELIEFDGIALFLYRDADVLADFISHPYYIDVIEPDERVFIDKSAFGSGMVATFIGDHFEVLREREGVWIGNEAYRADFQKLFESYL